MISYTAIITAMEEEYIEIEGLFDKKEVSLINSSKICIGSIYQKNVVLVKCGIGKVNAAISTQLIIDRYNIDCVINVGVAGALNPIYKIGDMIIGKELIQYDFDLTSFGRSLGEIPGIEEKLYSEERLIERIQEISADKVNLKIYSGKIGTADTFLENKNKKLELFKNYAIDAVDMEGAAIAQVCFLSKIKFLAIRSISDTLEGNNIEFDKYLKTASKKCGIIINKFLKMK